MVLSLCMYISKHFKCGQIIWAYFLSTCTIHAYILWERKHSLWCKNLQTRIVIFLSHLSILIFNTGTTSWQCCWGNHLGTSTAELLWLHIFLTPQPIMQKLSPPFSLHRESTEWERRNPRLVHKQAAINSFENEFS